MVLELRRILGRMEAALSAISDALVITDDQGMVLWCNRSFDQLINQPRMLVLGHPIISLLPLDAQGQPLLSEAQLASASQVPGSITVLLQRQPLNVHLHGVNAMLYHMKTSYFRDVTQTVTISTSYYE
jgi:PAS domain-containing protein